MDDLNSIDKRLKAIEAFLSTQKTILNLEEVANYIGLSKSYLYKLTSAGGIPCYKPQGKHIYFNKQEIDQWLMQNRKATTQEIDNEANSFVTLKKGGVK